MLELGLGGPGAADLRRVSRRLREVGSPKAIRRELTVGLRAAARPAQQDAKAAARALPAQGPHTTGLRRRGAAAVSTQVRTSGRNPRVAVRLSRARMGDKAGVLGGFNRKGFIRHPVFGDREVWVRQESTRAWFDRPMQAHRFKARREVAQVLNRIERKLDD